MTETNPAASPRMDVSQIRVADSSSALMASISSCALFEIVHCFGVPATLSDESLSRLPGVLTMSSAPLGSRLYGRGVRRGRGAPFKQPPAG